MCRNMLAISPVCPRHCSIEFMKHVLPRLDIPTLPPDSGNLMSAVPKKNNMLYKPIIAAGEEFSVHTSLCKLTCFPFAWDFIPAKGILDCG